MKQLAVFALAIICLCHWRPGQAAPPAPAVEEINYLLDFVGRSGCKFYRNGSWYDSHRAQSHLRDKYNFLAARGRIKTADDFIELAATRSSMSGEEYQIQCEAGPTVPSNRWLRTALSGYRSGLHRVDHDGNGARTIRDTDIVIGGSLYIPKAVVDRI